MKRSALATSSRQREVNATEQARAVAAFTGFLFVTAGIAGFIPGITTNLDELHWVGHGDTVGPQAQLLGVFHISVLHNLIHLGTGLIAFAAATRARPAAQFLLWGGIAYATVLVYGLVVDFDSEANFIPVDAADNWLHAGLAAWMVITGATLMPARARRGPDDAHAS